MHTVLGAFRRKPARVVLIALVYVLTLGLLKWGVAPPLTALWFLAGAYLGIYFLDIAEAFFHLTPSPFRSIVFQALFIIVSFFIMSSSDNLLASGLVLTIYFSMLTHQIEQWRQKGNLDSWYTMVEGPVTVEAQRWGLIIACALFLLVTLIFIRL